MTDETVSIRQCFFFLLPPCEHQFISKVETLRRSVVILLIRIARIVLSAKLSQAQSFIKKKKKPHLILNKYIWKWELYHEHPNYRHQLPTVTGMPKNDSSESSLFGMANPHKKLVGGGEGRRRCVVRGGVWVWVVMVVVRTRCNSNVSVDIAARMHPKRVTQHPGVNSRRPRHPQAFDSSQL